MQPWILWHILMISWLALNKANTCYRLQYYMYLMHNWFSRWLYFMALLACFAGLWILCSILIIGQPYVTSILHVLWLVYFVHTTIFLYARLKNGRIMPWQCPSVRLSVCPSVRPGFPDFSSTCFEISIWNLVYTFSRWHDMSSLSCMTIGSLWPSLQPKVGQTHFLQSWPHKSR